jgi:Uma2 family endonuclease
MSSPSTSETVATGAADASPQPDKVADEAPEVYDRSSLRGDFMVALFDQTEEDFFRYAPENRFCEFIDGVVYMPSPVSWRHQEIVQFLFHLLDAYRCEKGLGPIFTGPAVLKLRAGRAVEPDIFVLPPGAGERGQVHKQYGSPPADLVVEVLSESTRTHDLQHKAILYREEGIAELWLIDGRNHLLLVERRGADGYHASRIEDGPHRSSAIPGFWIDVSWLWADPLPNARRCLETILAGPPA